MATLTNLAPWLGLLLAVVWSLEGAEGSKGSLSFDAELSAMFDDGDLKDNIRQYLDLVPSSHRSRAGASRMMRECSCKSKKKVKSVMKASGIHKHTGAYQNSLPDILDITLEHHRAETKEECLCHECPASLREAACAECPKPPDCELCPACPMPKGCQPVKPGQKCPEAPKCQLCINVTSSGKSDLAHLIIVERQRDSKWHEFNISTIPALIDQSPISPSDDDQPNKAASSTTTTTKPAKKPSRPSKVKPPSKPTKPKPPKAPKPPKPPTPVGGGNAAATTTTKKPAASTTTTKRATTTKKTAAAAKTTTMKAAPVTTTSTTKRAKATTTRSAKKKPSKRPASTGKPGAPGPKVPGAGPGMHFFSNQTTSTETKQLHSPDGSFTTSTTTTSTTTRMFSGLALFEANMNLIKNFTLRDQIMKVIDNVPDNTGGTENFMAKRLLMRFGENTTTTTTVHKRGHHRAFTCNTAKHNVKSILGHMMEARRRKLCHCPKCAPRKECKKCEEPKPCPPRKCEPCRSDGFCPAPDGCPKYKLCEKCEPDDTEDPDYDGHKDDQDDVDNENPIGASELEREKNPGQVTLAYVDKCGSAPLNPLSPGKSTGYMNGGEDELYGEWPSFVRLDISMPDGTKGLCGGVLVSNGHVLTAGHCVKTPRDGDKDGKNIEANAFTVHLADHKKKDKDQFEETRKVKSICRSTKFNDPKGEGSRYDFALLTLDKNVTFNDHIQPACLPWKPLKLDQKKSQCFVVGLGVIKYREDGNHQFADIVQKMRLQRASCRSWGFKHDDRSRWCWTKYFGKGDSCGGDSGGPILCLNHKRKWTIQGLVSYGSTACDGTEHSGWIGVYTRIPALLDRMTTDCKL